jgi:CO/xanthine dehydrogenase FAD-binding subunit
MKPAPFEYFSPSTLEEAIALLEEHGEDAKVLAGGQSLIPLMNMRLALPKYIIDINKVQGLDQITEVNGHLEIGALARHYMVASSELIQGKCPLLAEAAKHIAHRQVRYRGSIGGSVAHADPAAEFPTVVTALEGEIKLVGPKGERWIKPEEFFLGYLMTTIAPTEILTEIRLPVSPAGSGWSVQELARKENYFAIAGTVCLLAVDGDSVTQLDLGLMGVSPAPLKPREAEDVMRGNVFSDVLVEEAARSVMASVEPDSDLHGSEAYRREMSGVVTKRALKEAFSLAVKGGKAS